MPLRFSGSYEQLQQKLASLAAQGRWQDVNENQKQFQHKNGGILNWYPSTGSLLFQGRAEGRKELEELVTAVFLGASTATEAKPAEQLVKPPADTPQKPQPSLVVEPAQSRGQTAAKGALAEKATGLTQQNLLGQTFSESELVLGLVGAVGTELKKVIDILDDRLKVFGYTHVTQIRVSDEIIATIAEAQSLKPKDEFERISAMMNAGDLVREKSGDNSVLALGVAAKIASGRPKSPLPEHLPRRAYIINSLKHPEEVERLREIYPQGFYLLGVHADHLRRHHYLEHDKRLTPKQADELMERDEDENLEYGQRTSDTFHMSDFFVRLDHDEDRLKDSVWRILDVLFGDPYRTPTFDEFAMFMAFSASLRSADLSRQVGAVVAKGNEILATGANDCPRFGGGLYWPEYDEKKRGIADRDDGRDYMRGQDSNKIEQSRIIDDIVRNVADVADKQKFREALEETRISDLTEFGRVVHAEMEAVLSCARNSISSRGATVYCTTFPCHNCAKHIVAAGIQRVVYVEPYPKSKAAEFHTDSISLGFSESDNSVRFEPFVGVGPRRFFDLFSMRLGSGYRLKRKDRSGVTLKWKQEMAKLRIQMLPFSYLDLETVASAKFEQYRKKMSNQP